MRYADLNFKIPQEVEDYESSSNHVIGFTHQVMRDAIENKRNRIVINTNLRLGLPMENIN